MIPQPIIIFSKHFLPIFYKFFYWNIFKNSCFVALMLTRIQPKAREKSFFQAFSSFFFNFYKQSLKKKLTIVYFWKVVNISIRDMGIEIVWNRVQKSKNCFCSKLCMKNHLSFEQKPMPTLLPILHNHSNGLEVRLTSTLSSKSSDTDSSSSAASTDIFEPGGKYSTSQMSNNDPSVRRAFDIFSRDT